MILNIIINLNILILNFIINLIIIILNLNHLYLYYFQIIHKIIILFNEIMVLIF